MPTFRLLAVAASVATLAGAFTLPAAPATAAPPERARRAERAAYRPTGRLVVGYHPGTTQTRRAAALAAAGVRVAERHAGPGIDVVTPGGGSAVAAAAKLRRQAGVRYVENESSWRAFDLTPPERAEVSIDHTDIVAAGLDGGGVEIAVIDTAIDTNNPDLVGAEYAGDYSHPVEGPTLACTPSLATLAKCSHGTAVAVVAAGISGGGELVGIAPAATVVSYNVFRDNGDSRSPWIAAAIRAAVDRSLADAGRKLRVINLSLGGPFESIAVREEIKRAHDNDIVVVVAAGNDGGERANYPAGSPYTLSVGATELVSGNWKLTHFSNRGDVDVLAPGVGVESYWAGQRGRVDGTSFAAPIVAGIAATLAEKGVHGAIARAAIVASAETPHATGFPAVANGAGRADVLTAWNLVKPEATAPFSAAFLDRGGQVASGVGKRSVEVVRVDPDPAEPNAHAVATASYGSLAAATSPAPAVTTVTTDGGDWALATRRYAFSAPGGAAGATGSLVVNATATGDDRLVLPLRLVDAANGPEGVPVTPGEPARSFAMSEGRTSFVRTVGLRRDLSMVVDYSFEPSSDESQLYFWAPPAAMGQPDAALEPASWLDVSNPNVDYPDGTASYSPVQVLGDDGHTGRYAVGFVGFGSFDYGTYGLGVGYPGPTFSPSVPGQVAAIQTTAPFTVRWGGSGQTTVRYDVQWTTRRLINGSLVTYPWKNWTGKVGTTSTSGVFGGSNVPTPVVPGETYFFRMRVYDELGNITNWAYRTAVVPLNNNSPGASYSTGWTHVGAGGRWLGNAHYATTGGRSFTVFADTSQFQLLGDKCTTCGQFKVYVDNVYKGTFDSRAGSTMVRQVLWKSGPLAGGVKRRKLTIVTVGTRGRPKVVVDGVVVSK